MQINIKKDDFIYPYFVTSGKNKKERIKNFPGVYRFSVDRLLKDIEEARKFGLGKVLLFGVPDKKDIRDDTVISAVRKIKDEFENLVVMTDVCLCAYTSHGHCGILVNDCHSEGAAKRRPKNLKERSFASLRMTVDDSATLEALTKIAVSHARAGADFVAPSAMAKKQVFVIRKALDTHGFKDTKIMGYSAKFASNFYGPFRNAAGSAPKFGDRSSYQLNFADVKNAEREIADDIKEGADIVMVKPALAYLDVIRLAKEKFNVPVAAYNVSGEYSFVKYGAKQGLWDEKKMVFEIMTAIKRAGADVIISYHAKDVAKWLS